MLCARHTEADPVVVFLFSIFHDAAREQDTLDPGHPSRGAGLARRMLGGRLSEDRLQLLEYACVHHMSGQTSTDPTVGVCWDADRLNLWRVGVEPDPGLLSTEAAPLLIERFRLIHEEALTWLGLVLWLSSEFPHSWLDIEASNAPPSESGGIPGTEGKASTEEVGRG
jgi:hypothetical protein